MSKNNDADASEAKTPENKWKRILKRLPTLEDIGNSLIDLLGIAFILGFILGVPTLIYFIAKIDNERDQAKAAVEKNLESLGYEKISCGYDRYIDGELLARRRCDDKFGVGSYVFKSTNFNGNVWYVAKPKETSNE